MMDVTVQVLIEGPGEGFTVYTSKIFPTFTPDGNFTGTDLKFMTAITICDWGH